MIKSLFFSIIFILISIPNVSAELNNWFIMTNGQPAKKLKAEKGEVKATLQLPGFSTIYIEKNRRTLRPKLDDFRKGIYSLEVMVSGKTDEKIKCNLFVKNKDGLWFQSQKVFELTPNIWQTLEVRLEKFMNNMIPMGHKSQWDSLYAVTMHTMGISIYSQEKAEVTLHCKNLHLSGERRIPDLSVIGWETPKNCSAFDMIESSFKLTREYFNPFDPKEIKVDVVAVKPDGTEQTWPAYYTQDYERNLHINKESLTPFGQPHWAFRFTPDVPGVYKLKLHIEDNSTQKPVTLDSNWIKLEVSPSKGKGFVRVSKIDKRYFEFSDGSLFYPVGFNIHSVKDVRSEQALNLGYIPDRGTYSYDEYFEAMSKNGVNAVELWMAPWSFAIEWTSARFNYYGLGRYNMANAWRLDYVLDLAKKKGIYVHLVLDNHGKLSTHHDPDWALSPFNKRNPYAVADGALLDHPSEFFSSKEAKEYNYNRNRYIAGRWGGYTTIFGVEFWSEIDLVENYKKVYDNNTSITWHQEAGQQFMSLDQGKHLLTTHTCQGYTNCLKYIKQYKIPEINYVVGDAYRKRTPIVKHMQAHTRMLKFIRKPLLITEYGGSPFASSLDRLKADLHAGMWASFFTEQAGTPFLWWHDYVHRMNNYYHYKAFSKYIQGIDPRNKNFKSSMKTVLSPENKVDVTLSALCYGNTNEFYGWIYNKSAMIRYPDNLKNRKTYKKCSMIIDDLIKGTYLIKFYDTLTGEEISSLLKFFDTDEKIIEIPDFKLDIAFKIFRQESGKGINDFSTKKKVK